MSYFKTAILLAGLTGLFMGVGYLLGGTGGMCAWWGDVGSNAKTNDSSVVAYGPWPSFTSARPFIADRHVRAFDAAIDPETRLVLAETGQQLRADADVITNPATQATWAAVTRRYG